MNIISQYMEYRYLLVIFIYIIIIGVIFTVAIISKINQIFYIGFLLLVLILVFTIIPMSILISSENKKQKMIIHYIKKHNVLDCDIEKVLTQECYKCTICLDNIDKNDKNKIFSYKDCLHTFHLKCIKNWIPLKKNCPICRRDYL